MIITCKKEIPVRWIIFAILPWASFGYTWSTVGVAFLFSLKKFVDNPAGLTFILSLPTCISVITGPCASFLSDRIWTRFGRRKPFIIASWIGIATSLTLMPLMPSFWTLVAAYMFYYLSTDLNALIEPLKQEIVPPHERGRATGAMQWCTNLAGIAFYFIALGRFDDVRFMAGVPIVGETVIYWSAALLLTVMLMLIMLGIKEVDQKSPLRGQKFSLRNIFGGILDLELRPVYLLVFATASLNAGLGPLSNLLVTDQWGYTKQDMGVMVAIGGVLNIVVLGFLMVIADKLNRLKAYRNLICCSIALSACYFCYVTFILPDQRPSLVEIITFGEVSAIVGMLTNIVYIPLAYDYIRRGKMGTYVAGSIVVNRLTTLTTLNGVGLFIWGYALLFEPAAGEMARVVLQQDCNRTEMRTVLRASEWMNPATGATAEATQVDAETWQANGLVNESGRSWELRLRDRDSEKLAKHKDELEREKSFLITELKLLGDKADAHDRKGRAAAAAESRGKVGECKVRVEKLDSEITSIQETLKSRAGQFEKQVVQVLGSRLMADGGQVLGATGRQAVLIEWPVNVRPDIYALEQMLGGLRQSHAEVIDLRPMKIANDGYAVVLSAVLAQGVAPEALVRTLQVAIERESARYQPGLFATGSQPLRLDRQPALSLELLVVEEPLDTYVSPIHRLVNVVLGWFDAVPKPDRRLSAVARSLCTPSGINHVRILAKPGERKISVMAVLPPNAPQSAAVDDAVGRALRAGLGQAAGAVLLPQARAFYDRVEVNASAQRITVARPVLASAYAPLKYNYMCGYLWMMMLGSVSLVITLIFTRWQSLGLVHKRGVEEAQAS